MRFEKLIITRILCDAWVNSLKYPFTQGMQSEKPGMTIVVFDT